MEHMDLEAEGAGRMSSHTRKIEVVAALGKIKLGGPGDLVFERSRLITLWDLVIFSLRRGT